MIMVFFPTESPLGIAIITKFTNLMSENNVQRGIIVYRDRVSSHARSVCGRLRPAPAPGPALPLPRPRPRFGPGAARDLF